MGLTVTDRLSIKRLFWARSGAMSVFGDRAEGPLIGRGGYGDRTTGLNLLASILAALRLKDQTGEGQYVEVTLQRTGIWSLASDVTTALFERIQPDRTSRDLPPNPIWNCYQTGDGRWLLLVMPMATPYWPNFLTRCVLIFGARSGWSDGSGIRTLPHPRCRYRSTRTGTGCGPTYGRSFC